MKEITIDGGDGSAPYTKAVGFDEIKINLVSKIHNLGKIYRTNYYKDGKLHRADGPAVIYYSGDKIHSGEFWLKGEKIMKPEKWFESLEEDEKILALFNINDLLNVNEWQQ